MFLDNSHKWALTADIAIRQVTLFSGVDLVNSLLLDVSECKAKHMAPELYGYFFRKIQIKIKLIKEEKFGNLMFV